MADDGYMKKIIITIILAIKYQFGKIVQHTRGINKEATGKVKNGEDWSGVQMTTKYEFYRIEIHRSVST